MYFILGGILSFAVGRTPGVGPTMQDLLKQQGIDWTRVDRWERESFQDIASQSHRKDQGSVNGGFQTLKEGCGYAVVTWIKTRLLSQLDFMETSTWPLLNLVLTSSSPGNIEPRFG